MACQHLEMTIIVVAELVWDTRDEQQSDRTTDHQDKLW